jgi:lipid-A-disaccharide synthase-like uncharacterized protein
VNAADFLINAAGWAGQACFFSRFLVQWIASERVRRSIVPSVFWHFSLAGSVLSAFYAWLGPSHDVVFVASYVFNIVVYVRNLALAGRPNTGLRPLPLTLLALAIAASAALAFTKDPKVQAMLSQESVTWLALGVIGQGLWVSRFLLQWILAERRGRSELPPVFFIVSLVGSFLLLAYAIHKRDAVLIAGQIPGPIVYGRNLILQRRSAGQGAEEELQPRQ